MNLDNLDRRVDKLQAAIGPQQEAMHFRYSFNMALFSEQEQARLQDFVAGLEPNTLWTIDNATG